MCVKCVNYLRTPTPELGVTNSKTKNHFTKVLFLLISRSIRLTAVAGLTGLHNCDPGDVTCHAGDVITDLVTTCLEDTGDQEISVAAMTCITSLLTSPDVTSTACLEPVFPDLCARVKRFLCGETGNGDTCPGQQAAALGVLQHVPLVTSGRDLEVVISCLILASNSHELTREEVVRALTAIGEVQYLIASQFNSHEIPFHSQSNSFQGTRLQQYADISAILGKWPDLY